MLKVVVLAPPGEKFSAPPALMDTSPVPRLAAFSAPLFPIRSVALLMIVPPE